MRHKKANHIATQRIMMPADGQFTQTQVFPNTQDGHQIMLLCLTHFLMLVPYGAMIRPHYYEHYSYVPKLCDGVTKEKP